MIDEDDLLLVSALSDFVFCKRRAALHHLEGVWEDNLFTIEGTYLHQKVDAETPVESRGDVRIVRGLRLRSLRLGLSGKADVVEFHRVQDGDEKAQAPAGVQLEGIAGIWLPFPVEYKRGILRHEESFEVQLCAQALCLEEMLHSSIPAGALFYGKSQRRFDVAFSPGLRAKTEAAASRLHELIRAGKTPQAKYEKKCEKCSLLSLCLPRATDGRKSARKYLADTIASTKRENKEEPI